MDLPDDLRRGMASKYTPWRAWSECDVAHERLREHAGRASFSQRQNFFKIGKLSLNLQRSIQMIAQPTFRFLCVSLSKLDLG